MGLDHRPSCRITPPTTVSGHTSKTRGRNACQNPLTGPEQTTSKSEFRPPVDESFSFMSRLQNIHLQPSVNSR